MTRMRRRKSSRPGYAQGFAQGCRYSNSLIIREMPRVPRVPKVPARTCAHLHDVSRTLHCFGSRRPSRTYDVITRGTQGTLGILNKILHYRETDSWPLKFQPIIENITQFLMLIKLQGKLTEKKEIKEFKRRSFFEQFLWDGRL